MKERMEAVVHDKSNMKWLEGVFWEEHKKQMEDATNAKYRAYYQRVQRDFEEGKIYGLETTLLQVATRGLYPVIHFILGFIPSDNKYILNALYNAIDNNHVHCIPLLYRDGFRFLSQHAPRSVEALDALILCGANVHQKLPGGMTLLYVAPNSEVLSALISYGLDINRRADNGMTPLMYMAQKHMVLHTFVERHLPDLFLRTYPTKKHPNGCTARDMAKRDDALYFDIVLPQRLVNCQNAVLFTLHCKQKFGGRDIAVLVARLVWKTRRQRIWDPRVVY